MPSACAASSADSTSVTTWTMPPSGAWPPRVSARERLALDELHHDVRPTIGELREVDDADDVLVPDQVDRARLREEPLEQIRIARALIRQHLDRDATADRRLDPEIHAPHAALAEQRAIR